jgi:N-acetylmuramoyl-L-alanine amidase
LSNRQDESNLRKKDYQRDLSRRLTAAILDYLVAHGPRLSG